MDRKPVTSCNRFDYVRYDETASSKSAEAKAKFQELERFVEEHVPAGRAKALVLTKIEEAYMWIGKAIRDDQVARTGQVELQEGRSNA